MDDIVHAEVSPGTIKIEPCNRCNNDALTFDIVALGTDGVGYMGTIVKCGQCEQADQQ